MYPDVDKASLEKSWIKIWSNKLLFKHVTWYVWGTNLQKTLHYV